MRLRAEFPGHSLCIAGDFNQSRDGHRWGKITWEQGKLILGDGAILQRKLAAGSWVEMKLDLEFPVLTKDGQSSDLKVSQRMPCNLSPCGLGIRTQKTKGQRTGQLTPLAWNQTGIKHPKTQFNHGVPTMNTNSITNTLTTDAILADVMGRLTNVSSF